MFWNESFLKFNGKSEADIKDVESKLQITLPTMYKAFMMQHDGGYIKNDSFDYFDNCQGKISHAGIGIMLHFNNKAYSLYGLSLNPPEFFPKGLVPFADDGGGNLTCFDYRKVKEDPPIVFWVCGDPEGENVHFVANNFEEFVNKLYKSEDL